MALFLVGFYAITLTRKDVSRENPPLPENGKKKRWTVEEKAQIVRRYLKDHGGLADLAEETGRTSNS